jgi:hypothetical protein
MSPSSGRSRQQILFSDPSFCRNVISAKTGISINISTSRATNYSVVDDFADMCEFGVANSRRLVLLLPLKCSRIHVTGQASLLSLELTQPREVALLLGCVGKQVIKAKLAIIILVTVDISSISSEPILSAAEQQENQSASVQAGARTRLRKAEESERNEEGEQII